jgi:hypothetical protein
MNLLKKLRCWIIKQQIKRYPNELAYYVQKANKIKCEYERQRFILSVLLGMCLRDKFNNNSEGL